MNRAFLKETGDHNLSFCIYSSILVSIPGWNLCQCIPELQGGRGRMDLSIVAVPQNILKWKYLNQSVGYMLSSSKSKEGAASIYYFCCGGIIIITKHLKEKLIWSNYM